MDKATVNPQFRKSPSSGQEDTNQREENQQQEEEERTLRRAAHKGLRTFLDSVAWVQCLKERARNSEACCLMEGFLLSITARTSSDRFWRVV